MATSAGNNSTIPTRPSRPSKERMAEIKSKAAGVRPVQSSTKKKTKTTSTPKVVGTRKSTKQKKSLAKNKKMSPAQILRTRHALEQDVYQGYRKARPTRYKSQNIPAAKRVAIEGRHYPSNARYKTGWWRPVREPWMSNTTWRFIKSLNKVAVKGMPKGLKKGSQGKSVYGKEGPGHAGYGTGELQKWVDYILHRNKGIDPHQIDLMHWFAGAAEALDFHFGKKDFDALKKEAQDDPAHMMHYLIKRLNEAMPGLEKLSKKDVNDIIKHRHYTVSYGPDGRAK